jgi:hypothetical protein
MRPAPASKYDDIILDLNEIAKAFDVTPYTFKLNRYKTDATVMIQDDPENSYSILGMIACIEKDIDSMHRYHKIALKCSSESARSLFQYSSSLYNHDLFEDSYKYAYKAFEKNKGDRLTLQLLLKTSYYLMKDEDYQLFKVELEKRKFKFNDPAKFNEDNAKILTKMVESAEDLIQKHPEMIAEPDPELEALVSELIEGVDIS